MATNRKRFRLWCRKDRGSVFYYRFPGDAWQSTNMTDRAAAEAHVNDVLAARRMAQLSGQRPPDEKAPTLASHHALKDYAADFFLWGKCPHCERVRADGGQIGAEHAERQRRLLDRFILSDPLAEKPIGQIRRGDCIDFRARLLAERGADVGDREAPRGKRTVNLVVTVPSTVLNEAVQRGDLEVNPACELAVKYRKRPRGTFNIAEIRKLFPAAVDQPRPWDSFEAKAAFLLAGVVGLRRNEVRALRWGRVDLAVRRIMVHEAFKGEGRPGLPKGDSLTSMSPMARPMTFGSTIWLPRTLGRER